MEILETSVEWFHGYMNRPSLKMVVDKIPPYDETIWQAVPHYEARENTTLISMNQYPILRFKHIANPNDPPNIGGALGGTHKMTDGSVFKTSCGWSSRVGVINRDFGYWIYEEEFIEVSMQDKSSGMQVYFAGLSLPVELAKKHLPEGIYLVREVGPNGEIYWHPSTDPNIVVKPNA